MMRALQFILAIAFLSLSGIVFAQERKVGEAELFAILKIILKSDSLSFEQFRNIGKCRCMDTIAVQKYKKVEERTRLYNEYHSDIAFGLHIFPEAVVEDTINSVLDRFYSENIGLTIEYLRKFDEYYNINRSSYMTCETMYSDIKKLRSLYNSVIESDNSYNKKAAWWNEQHILHLIALLGHREYKNKR
ncbi:MAG: hypothetical protein FWC26_01055 [Fibromonadales bacterium]|nr:hypothetical protein [Fibromonadales bacterium]